MAYEKYTTTAIVLGSFERREADKTLVLYTAEYGLIYSTAIGFRKEASRMRSALQDYSIARVSLIRGKSSWRIAGAEEYVNSVGKSAEGVATCARIAKLLRRLIHGEEANPYLFNTLKEAYVAFLADDQMREVIELVCVARILYALGYLSPQALGSAVFAHTSYDGSEITALVEKKKDLTRSINEAISESQL